jgi:shikimate dehydrogenase
MVTKKGVSHNEGYVINLNPQTKFLFSTSGSASSISKHNDALKKLGLDLVYFTFQDVISPEIYSGLLRSPITRGGAVTGKGGLKSTIIPFLDYIEPIAKKTLAVNTVINRQGKLNGYNTDAYGLKIALSKGIKESNLKIKSAVIYGNGGVSGVAYFVLKELGIKVALTGRNKAHVLKKKKELGIINEPIIKGPYDLIVDATPISSDPNFIHNAIGFSKLLNGCKIVFSHNMPEKDNKINYLQKYCKSKNLFFIPGNKMYVFQLIKQFGTFK